MPIKISVKKHIVPKRKSESVKVFLLTIFRAYNDIARFVKNSSHYNPVSGVELITFDRENNSHSVSFFHV